MKPDTKNYYLALALSVLVVFGWNLYYGKPKLEKDRQAQSEAANPANPNAPGRPGSPTALPPQTVNTPSQGGVSAQNAVTRGDRRTVLANGPRIVIDTPSVVGSIALKGASLDDVSLKKYRETQAKDSPLIVLLSPRGAPDAYVAESGFFAPAGVNIPLPNADTVWTKSAGDRLTPTTPVTLTWDNGQGLVFTRTFSIDADYMFTIADSVENKGTAAVTLTPYSLVLRQGLPATSGYSVLHEGFIGDVGSKEMEEKYADVEKEPGGQKRFEGTGGWIGFTDKYWATAVIPDQRNVYSGTFLAYTNAGEKNFETVATSPQITIAPAGKADTTSRLFAGAKVVSMLNAYQKDLGIINFNLLIDWGWFWFVTQPMFWLIDNIYKLVGNFGVAIIAVTFVVKLVFFPLANRSYMSMAKMKAAQPQLAALKEKYPDDKMKQQQEMMAIYKREKINPVAGCLPMVIQIPVFFALYKVLFITIEMRQAPFVLWIRDLSQPDPTNIFNLFGLIPFNPTTLPLVGHFLAIGILPLVMGFTMFLQMKMNPEPTDPVQKTMFAWMPVIFTFMLGTFPSGLVVYWTVNNTLTILQQSVIMKRAGVKLELFDNLRGMFGGSKPDPTSPAAIAASKRDLKALEAEAEGKKVAPGE